MSAELSDVAVYVRLNNVTRERLRARWIPECARETINSL